MLRSAAQSTYRLGFVMEQAMGHVTHHRAMLAEAARDPSVQATCMAVPYHADDLWQRMPAVSDNLSLLLSVRARRTIARRRRIVGDFDGLFFHTQVTALLSLDLMRSVPTVVSLDATPLNADPQTAECPSPHARRPDGRGPWDRLKRIWNRRAFRRAAALITWSEWARASLIRDYGIPSEKVRVIPPGVDLSLWRPAKGEKASERLRMLFVGAHFARKGGDVLMSAFRALGPQAELDIVTPDTEGIPQTDGNLRVHRNLAINSSELRGLYAAADLFVLPTLNDCTPLVILEAMASGLPVVSTDIGAIREQVIQGETGLLVRPGDAADLAGVLRSLAEDPDRRRRMGRAARARADERYCAKRNYGQVLGLLKTLVDASRSSRAAPANGSRETPFHRLNLNTGSKAWASEH